MSTKIYNGFKLKFNSLEEFFPVLMELRKEFLDIAKEQYIQVFAQLLTEEVDRITFNNSKDQKGYKKEVFFFIESEIRRRQLDIKKTGRRDPEIDFEFNMVLLPHILGIYGIYYTENAELEKRFRSKDYFIDTGYWNNTDQDENCTEEEWEEREKIWDELVPDYKAPCMHGFTTEVVLNQDIIFQENIIQKIIKNIPAKQKRVKKVAKQKIIDERIKIAIAKKEVDPESTSSIIGAIRNIDNWITETEKGKIELAHKMNEISDKIVDINKEFLLS